VNGRLAVIPQIIDDLKNETSETTYSPIRDLIYGLEEKFYDTLDQIKQFLTNNKPSNKDEIEYYTFEEAVD
jgi:hypothetical protein